MYYQEKKNYIQVLINQSINYRQVKFDEQMCVAAVQKNSETWFEIFDFGAL